jgi:hypothetical protein
LSSPYKRSGRGTDKKGRSNSGAPFIQIPIWIYDSEAYRSLSAQDRALHTALIRRYNGTNNGMIGLGVRDAGEECRLNKDTAGAGLRRLIDKGFIECTTPGGFSCKMRLASEWRLTHLRCDKSGELPSKAFMKWRPTPAETKPRTETAKPALRAAA